MLVAGVLASGLAGCAATTTAVSKRNLDVQTRMTESVFLEPVPPDERTIYVEVRNTSDKPELDLQSQVRQGLAARGYTVVDDPRRAQFVLQANVLQAGRSTETATEAAYQGGFGGNLLGGAAGGAIGYGIGRAGGGNDVLLGAAGAIAGAAIEGISGAYVQDVTYSIVSDVQISERAQPGEVVTQSDSASLQQGTSGSRSQSSSRMTSVKTQRTRIVSTANQVNLDWPQASPALVEGLSRSIVGLF
jgi:hypothetical protein